MYIPGTYFVLVFFSAFFVKVDCPLSVPICLPASQMKPAPTRAMMELDFFVFIFLLNVGALNLNSLETGNFGL